MSDPSISFDVQAPARYSRMQVLLRLALVCLLALLQARLTWILAVSYLLLPVLAAVSIQNHDGAGYAEESRSSLLRVLHWWSAFVAFLFFVSDRFPGSSRDLASVRLEVAPGEPIVATQALLRLVTSLPDFVAVLLLGWVASVLAVIAAACVLVAERVPEFIRRFASFYVSLQARFLAHHAGLTGVHPLLDARRLQSR